MKLTLNDLGISKSSDVLNVLQAEKKRRDLLKELKLELQQATNSDITEFQKFGVKYFRRPDLFGKEIIQWPEGQSLTPYQSEILLSIPTKERVAVRGPRGLGKTALASIAILQFCLTREALGLNWKAIITAGSYGQLRRFLWPEVKLFAARVKWDLVGRGPFCTRTELLSDALQLGHGEAFVLSPDRPELAEGLHADHTLVIIDESKIVNEQLWNSIEGFFSGSDKSKGKYAFCLSISTPGPPLGMFYRIFQKERGLSHWHTRHVQLQEALDSGVIAQDHVERLREAWGENSALYQQQVLGNFFADDNDAIIPLHWIEAAVARGETEDE